MHLKLLGIDLTICPEANSGKFLNDEFKESENIYENDTPVLST